MAEAHVSAHVILHGIYGGQNGTGTDFHQFLWFSPINVIPLQLSIFMYHFGDKQ
jgi:hypothetical protein